MAKIHAEADPGFRGIIGAGSTAPAGYSAIGLRFDGGTEATPKTSMPSWPQPSPTALRIR
jgi:hypothetical protein